MIDQSFSAQNLRRIWDLRTRRGEDLSTYFADIASITQHLKSLGVARHTALKALRLGTSTYAAQSDSHKKLRVDAQELKEELLKKHLTNLSVEINNRIDADDFHWGISLGPVAGGKRTYRIDPREVATYFISRQVELNLRNAFAISPSDRNTATRQLLLSLEDDIEKIVIRTDIRDFYESVPHDALCDLLRSSGKLSRTTYRFITTLLAEYSHITGTRQGLPRGLAVSAALAEVYLTKLDFTIRQMSEVLLYLRYVDDIIVIFGGSSHHPDRAARARELRGAIRTLGLSLNSGKTRYYTFSRRGPRPAKSLTFLGYTFQIADSGVTVDISEKKVRRYERRMELTYKAYLGSGPGGSPERTLLDRLGFLTGNTRLSNNKRNALVGIYFSNSLLKSATPQLHRLDARHAVLREGVTLSPQGMTSLAAFSFARGYDKRIYLHFSPKRLQRIVKIWTNDEEA